MTEPGTQRERDHYVEAPASWVAAVCDRGMRHPRNEDAIAVAATPEPGARAVLVVCDGVSTSQDSDVASLAGARAGARSLGGLPTAGPGRRRQLGGSAIAAAIDAAAAAANQAVIAHTTPDSPSPASCTFSAAVLEGDLLVHGNVGDSRSYWIPDRGSPEPPIQLTVDDSMAQMRMSAGVPRAEAEDSPGAHAILKWLGRDSGDANPTTGSGTITGPGWVLVCTDGLWNYASEARALQSVVADLSREAVGPVALAEALVRWANDQGGKDNISVALARHG